LATTARTSQCPPARSQRAFSRGFAEDFAPALDFEVPKRRVFLGALQKLAGVQVQYDRRLYDRRGQLLRKTTFYRFTPMPESATDKPPADLPLLALAA
jgi:hypothetical protein